jgi:hypothetical protein
MKTVSTVLAALALVLTAAGARADDGPPVRVALAHPERYTDFRTSCVSRPADVRALADEVERFLRAAAAPLLPEGGRLEVTITDVDMAGDIESWRGPGRCDLRVMKDASPPRIALRFRLTDAEGTETRAGHRLLLDSNYLVMAGLAATHPLRHEKAPLADWLRRELREDAGS